MAIPPRGHADDGRLGPGVHDADAVTDTENIEDVPADVLADMFDAAVDENGIVAAADARFEPLEADDLEAGLVDLIEEGPEDSVDDEESGGSGARGCSNVGN